MVLHRLLLLSACTVAMGCAMFIPHLEGPTTRKGVGLDSAIAALTPEDTASIKSRQLFDIRLARAMNIGSDGVNACFSPLSIDHAMSLFLSGSQAGSFDACSRVMGLINARVDKLNETNSRLLDVLASQPGQPYVEANSVWNIFPTRFDKQYQLDMAKYYDAYIQKIGSARTSALKQINDWVDEKSKGQVKSVVQKLDPLAMAFVVSVTSLTAEWETPFPVATSGTFNSPQGQKKVAMLHDGSRSVETCKSKDFDALTLPYKGGSLAVSLVVPEGEAPPLSVLTTDMIEQVTTRASKTVADVTFPKFKFLANTEMEAPISALGGKSLFGPDNNFSLMSREMRIGVSISRFLHIASIAADENGSQSGLPVTTEGRPVGSEAAVKFLADRPFLFFVWERNTGSILFLGVVNDPEK